MERPISTLFMLMSVGDKISTGSTDGLTWTGTSRGCPA